MVANHNIDLDIEFKRLVRDYGWWMVLRSFDLTKRSTYWDETSHEAVGGPAWEYNDIIFKGRRKESVQGNVETYEMRQQLTDIYSVVFYVMSKIRPKKEDLIIEIPLHLRLLNPGPPKNVTVHEIFDIKHVESKIEKGLVFSKCYCVKHTPTDDVTLDGSFSVKHVKLGV